MLRKIWKPDTFVYNGKKSYLHTITTPNRFVRWATVATSASKGSIRRFVITEKAPTRAFSWLKAATTAFNFKTLLRHYAIITDGQH